MNTIKGKSKFINLRILLDSGCSYTILMVSLVEKLSPKKYYVIQWHKQDGNIAINLKVEVNFTLPEIIATYGVKWKYHVYDSSKGRYNMVLGRDILT